MKKTYKTPQMEVVKIQTASMLAGSTQSIGFGGGYQDVGGAASRDYYYDEEQNLYISSQLVNLVRAAAFQRKGAALFYTTAAQ